MIATGSGNDTIDGGADKTRSTPGTATTPSTAAQTTTRSPPEAETTQSMAAPGSTAASPEPATTSSRTAKPDQQHLTNTITVSAPVRFGGAAGRHWSTQNQQTYTYRCGGTSSRPSLQQRELGPPRPGPTAMRAARGAGTRPSRVCACAGGWPGCGRSPCVERWRSVANRTSIGRHDLQSFGRACPLE